ncbi:uncharacterized protein K460DRAFT_432272 [Cucurbitaria berberidis CBS 394.84]|uniref:Uncharacterized protein n=1 Tax=Cucurbitaria berberidis CBS 394.84 TaxID=1168544 RepID=A0A9P4GBK7_9PLEO|nr:uncharacterized protein K460DRAFT_432272 [Cucurbitaria berberidis CBS 394.84]KAF1842838.1 hypothetical protein K460DRAFT_432272 [Cucurbitaria berberidis CBS 394.84]
MSLESTRGCSSLGGRSDVDSHESQEAGAARQAAGATWCGKGAIRKVQKRLVLLECSRSGRQTGRRTVEGRAAVGWMAAGRACFRTREGPRGSRRRWGQRGEAHARTACREEEYAPAVRGIFVWTELPPSFACRRNQPGAATNRQPGECVGWKRWGGSECEESWPESTGEHEATR